MDKPTVFILDWYKLNKEQKNLISQNKIVSIKQIINNYSNYDVEKISDLFPLFAEDDGDVLKFKKLLKDIQNQNELFGTINNNSIRDFNYYSDNILERIGSIFLNDTVDNKRYISTLNDHFKIYLHILNNSGVVYAEQQVSGRVNSAFLRKSKNERIEQLKKQDYTLLTIDFKACQPSILNSFLNIFPEKDFYTGLSNALEISRDEAKELALKKYVWGPIKHEKLEKIYEWRTQFYNRIRENNNSYTMKNGKTIYLENMDENELLNRYCQAAEAQMVHDVCLSCLPLLNGKSYLAAIIYDELIFNIHKTEIDLIPEIESTILNKTDNKLEIKVETIK